MSEIGKMLTQAWKRLMNRSVRARMNHPILMALLLKDMLLAGSTMRDPSPWFAEAAHRARCSPSSQSEAQEPTILGIRRSCFASYYSFTTSHLCRAALFDSLLNELQCFHCECDHVLLPITTKTCIQLACKRLPMLACNCQCYIATVKSQQEALTSISKAWQNHLRGPVLRISPSRSSCTALNSSYCQHGNKGHHL